MSISTITNDVNLFAPAVIAGVQAAEVSSASGQDKKQAVLDAIRAGAAIGTAIPIPQVAAISGLIDLVVAIFNALGVFRHKAA